MIVLEEVGAGKHGGDIVRSLCQTLERMDCLYVYIRELDE